MKLSHKELTGQRDLQNDVSRREPGIVSRTFARCAIIGALAFASPLIGGTAFAQQPTPVPETTQPRAAAPSQAQPTHRVRGETTSLSDGSTSISAYIVIRGSQTPSIIEVDGPARITLLFYPVVSRDRFTTPDAQVQRSIGYSLGPAGGTAASSTYDGNTRMSAFTNRDVDQAALVIGTPIEMTVNVAAGRQSLTFPDMNGFFQVVRVEAPAPPRPAQPAQPAQTAVRPAAPVQTPASVYDEPLTFRRPLAMFEGGYVPLRGLGTTENSGDMYDASVYGNIPLSDRFGMLVGGKFGSIGLTLQGPAAETHVRNYSADLTLGASYRSGRHYAYAMALLGYRGISTHILSISDNREISDLTHSFEFGGMAGYDYGRFFSIRVQGGNNPFNPLSARIMGAVPYTWTPGVYPWMEADFRWFHALSPVSDPSYVSLTRLDDNAFYLRALVGIPIYRLGPVVPAFVGGGEMNFAGGSVRGTGIFGGALKTQFVPGLEIDAIGAATLHGNPLVFLRIGYSL